MVWNCNQIFFYTAYLWFHILHKVFYCEFLKFPMDQNLMYAKCCQKDCFGSCTTDQTAPDQLSMPFKKLSWLWDVISVISHKSRNLSKYLHTYLAKFVKKGVIITWYVLDHLSYKWIHGTQLPFWSKFHGESTDLLYIFQIFANHCFGSLKLLT